MKNVICEEVLHGWRKAHSGQTEPTACFRHAKVGDRGQIVIPKEARELFGIKPGDTLLILGEEETGLIVSRPEILNNLANQILTNVKKED